MLSLQNLVLANLYVEERLEQAAKERLLRAVERARREQRERAALKTRVGRTLVHIGQRLEASARTTDRNVEMGLR